MGTETYCVEVAKDKIVEVEKDSCYGPDKNKEVSFNVGGFGYTTGRVVDKKPTHYFEYSGSLSRGSKLKRLALEDSYNAVTKVCY